MKPSITSEKAQKISKANFYLNLGVFLYILAGVAINTFENSGPPIYPAVLVSAIVVVLFCVIATISLSSKLYHPVTTTLLAILVFVPVLGGLILLMTSNSANKTLRKSGYKMTFFGSIKR